MTEIEVREKWQDYLYKWVLGECSREELEKIKVDLEKKYQVNLSLKETIPEI